MNDLIQDKKTIGLTPVGERIINDLLEQKAFNNMLDAARFAMALAIRRSISLGQLESTTTIWNIGSFDSDGDLQRLIPIIYPGCTTPYRAVEFLIDAGLRQIAPSLEYGRFDLSQLLKGTTISTPRISNTHSDQDLCAKD